MSGIIGETVGPSGITETALKIYREKFQEKFERDHKGQYAVINIDTGKAYVEESSVKALQKARKAAPNGVFHLIRIGTPAMVRSGRQPAWPWGA